MVKKAQVIAQRDNPDYYVTVRCVSMPLPQPISMASCGIPHDQLTEEEKTLVVWFMNRSTHLHSKQPKFCRCHNIFTFKGGPERQ